MMHIVEITTHGAPRVLRVGQRPVPQAGEGELLIRVSASGVNRPDVLQRMGHYPVPCLLYTSPSPRDRSVSRMPSSA